MVVARIQFREQWKGDFCFGDDQSVSEIEFESVETLIETLREFEPYIYNATVLIHGKVLDLRDITGIGPSAEVR